MELKFKGEEKEVTLQGKVIGVPSRKKERMSTQTIVGIKTTKCIFHRWDKCSLQTWARDQYEGDLPIINLLL